MSKWIKGNLVLVSGILLPVLLIVGFFVLSQVPKILTDPPSSDFLVVAYRNDYQHPRDYHLSFEVRDGHLHGRAVPIGEGSVNYNQQHAGIFRYKVAENSFDEIAYELPDGLDDIEETVKFLVEEASGITLDKRAQSPDGYRFEFLGYKGRGGLLVDIFGMGRRYESNYVLTKDSAHFNLPKPASDAYYYQHNLHFMGWVSKEGSAQ